jgi:hypothetical protein
MEITITEHHAESNNEDFEPTLFEGFTDDLLWSNDDDA